MCSASQGLFQASASSRVFHIIQIKKHTCLYEGQGKDVGVGGEEEVRLVEVGTSHLSWCSSADFISAALICTGRREGSSPLCLSVN